MATFINTIKNVASITGTTAKSASTFINQDKGTVIQRDAVSQGNDLGAGFLFTHVCSGNNRCLFVTVQGRSTGLDSVKGAYYGDNIYFGSGSGTGQAMTLVSKYKGDSDRYLYLFFLADPTEGTHFVSITKNTGAGHGTAFATSYKNVAQVGQPESFVTNTAISVSSLATNITTTIDNSWFIGASRVVTGGVITAGADTYVTNVSPYNLVLFDRNGAITPAGVATANLNVDIARNIISIVAVISPYSTNWANSSKNIASPTNITKNSASFVNQSKSS